MILDKQLQFSGEQALTVTAASTNVIDLSSDRDIAIGEPVAVIVALKTELGGTTPTLQVEVQADDNDAFSSALVIAQSQQFSALEEGALIVIPLPFDNEQYLRLRFVLGGTSPTATVDAYLQPQRMVDGFRVHDNAYTIV